MSFMILVFLVMINMLLAIIMDVYTEVKTSSSSDEKLWEQGAKIVQKLWQFKKWVSDEEILFGLRDMQKLGSRQQPVTASDLQQRFPKLLDKQAEQLIDDAMVLEEAEAEGRLSMANAIKLIGVIKGSVDRIENKVEAINKKAMAAGIGKKSSKAKKKQESRVAKETRERLLRALLEANKTGELSKIR